MKKYLLPFKIIVVVLFVLAGLVLVGSQKAQAADLGKSVSNPPSNLECHWVDSAHIVCTTGGLLADLANRTTQTQCQGATPQKATYDTCIDFAFAALESQRAGYVIFKGNETQSADTDRHLSFTTNDPAAAAWYERSGSNPFAWEPPPINTPTNVTLTSVRNAAKSAESGKCSVFVTASCDGTYNTSSNNTSKGLDTSLFRQQIMIQAAKEIALSDCNDKAPIGFIFCPLLNAINGTIASLIGGNELVQGQRGGLLVSFLQLPPLLGQNSTFGQVVGNVVTIANIIYVFVFLILIFSSTLPFGLDNYTIKKTLPKFIAAVILTQFSVLICGVIVDVFNLLGNAIPNVIYFLASGAAIGGNSGQEVVNRIGTNVSTNLIGGAIAIGSILGYLLIFIFAFIALIAGLIAIVYMVIRYFILYMLVLVAPLAFVAWVIPGTEKFFTNWWKNFIRLNAMYVTIMALLSGSLLLSSILQGLFPTNDPASLIPSLIPLVALMLIPKTLKWTTQGMAALGSLGAVAGRMNAGVKPAKSMTQKGMKAGKEGVQNKAAESRFGQTRLGGAIAGGGIGSVLGTRGAQRKVAARQAKLRSERSTEASIMYAQMKAAGRNEADIVRAVGSNKSSQFGLMAAAAQAGDYKTIQALQGTMSEESWKEGVNANYAAFDKISPYREFSKNDGFAVLDDSGNVLEPANMDPASARGQAFGKLSSGDLAGMSGKLQSDLAKAPNSSIFDLIPKQSFLDIATDPSSRVKIVPELRAKFAQWAHDPANSSDPIAARLRSSVDANGNWI